MKLFKDLYDSFHNNKGGFSARKLTGFTIVMCIVYIHYKHVDYSNSAEILLIDCVFALLLFGIITAEQVIKFKDSSK